METENATSVCLRLRGESQDAGQQIFARAPESRPSVAAGEQRTHEAQQSDERPGGIGTPERNLDTARVGKGCSRKNALKDSEWRTHPDQRIGECQHPGTSSGFIQADEREQPNVRSGDCGCGCGEESREWRISGGFGAIPRIVGRPEISSGTSATDETRQSNARSQDSREVPAGAVGAGGTIEDGTLVLAVVPNSQMANLDVGNWRILGTWSQPRFQGTWSQDGDRDNGHIHLSQTFADPKELRGPDCGTLREPQSFVFGDYDAATSKEMGAGFAQLFGDCGSGLFGDGPKQRVEFHPVDSIVVKECTETVYNLQTSLGTYIANDMVTHNCHFAYTHTRGPLAGKRDKPSSAIPGGDLMDKVLAIQMLDQFAAAGVQSVTWTGGGEPTLHPHFDEIVCSTPYGLEQGLYTHGGHIGNERAALLKRKMTWVFVSLDECTHEMYKKSKDVDRLDRAIQGIQLLVEAEGNATIGVGFLLHRGNWESISRMVELGKEMGVDYVQFRPTIHFKQDAPNRLGENTEYLPPLIRLLRQHVHDPFVIADLRRFQMYHVWGKHKYKTCHWSAMQTVITPNGKVWTCANKREHASAELGDLTQESFAEIWARAGKPCAVDSQCRVMCRGHLPNLTLDALMEEPAHAAFI